MARVRHSGEKQEHPEHNQDYHFVPLHGTDDGHGALATLIQG
jgi:hypothetical protein